LAPAERRLQDGGKRVKNVLISRRGVGAFPLGTYVL
jgi:hypothetical protein